MSTKDTIKTLICTWIAFALAPVALLSILGLDFAQAIAGSTVTITCITAFTQVIGRYKKI